MCVLELFRLTQVQKQKTKTRQIKICFRTVSFDTGAKVRHIVPSKILSFRTVSFDTGAKVETELNKKKSSFGIVLFDTVTKVH